MLIDVNETINSATLLCYYHLSSAYCDLRILKTFYLVKYSILFVIDMLLLGPEIYTDNLNYDNTTFVSY
jgi:hypothetical protein